MKLVTTSVTLALALSSSSLFALTPGVQADAAAKPHLTRVEESELIDHAPLTTFYLANVSQPSDANEILTAIRNMLNPSDKVLLVPARNAIVIRALPDDIELTRKLIADLDRPRKTYRLTYTVTELDGGKRIGLQHFSMVIAAGAKTDLKQGSRVPVATGSYTTSTSSTQSQFTYLDIGLSVEAALDQSTDGLNLRSKLEQSSLAEDKSSLSIPDPIIRQSILEGTASLTAGKPLTLGSLDIPGSTRHLDIEVVLEPIH